MSRVLYACTAVHGHGGIQRFNRNVLSACVDFNVELDILSLNDGAAELKEFHNTRGIQCYYAGSNKVYWVWWLLRLLLRNKYDTVVCGHVHMAPMVALALIISTHGFKGSVLFMHGVEIWGRVKGTMRIAAGRFESACAVSHYTRESFLAQVPIFDPRMCLVFPNTLSPNCLYQHVDEHRSYVQDGVLRLLSVTRLAVSERDKGICDVLRALGELKGNLKFEYEIIGDGDDRSFLARTARDLGIADRVLFLGAISDEAMWAAYRQADVFILPSGKEGMGIVFLEAMYFCLPIIGANEKGAVDAFVDGKNGFLVPFKGIEAIKACITRLAHSPEMCAAMGGFGRSLVVGDGPFGRSAFKERILDVFVGPDHANESEALGNRRNAPSGDGAQDL